MEHIKNLLSKHLKQTGLAKNIKTALVIEEFEKIVKDDLGFNVSRKIKPIYIKAQILHVACLSSVIVQEFAFHKQEIIKKINKRFQEEVLKDIKFAI